MTLKSLSIAGLGILGAGAVSVGGYAISTRGGTSSSSEEQDEARNQQLLSNDYTLKPPRFTSYEKLGQDCYENLIKNTSEDEDFEEGKLYGCGVAKMELWDSGDQFGNEKVHYLNFGSEIFLRKGEFAWRINTLIDNHSSGRLIYKHLLSYFEKLSGDKWGEKEGFLIIEKVPDEDQKAIESPKQSDQGKLAVSVGKKELNIKVPEKDGSWFKKANYLIGSSASQVSTLIKNKKTTKEWSGMWVGDSKKKGQGIFQDIEVFIEKQENSQVFCKEGKCGAGIGEKYQVPYWVINKNDPKTWKEAQTTLTNNSRTLDKATFTNHEGHAIAILNFIKNSKGKWTDSKDICGVKNTKISSKELKNLKMFCSDKQN